MQSRLHASMYVCTHMHASVLVCTRWLSLGSIDAQESFDADWFSYMFTDALFVHMWHWYVCVVLFVVCCCSCFMDLILPSNPVVCDCHCKDNYELKIDTASGKSWCDNTPVIGTTAMGRNIRSLGIDSHSYATSLVCLYVYWDKVSYLCESTSRDKDR